MVESDWIWTIFIKPNPKVQKQKHVLSIWSNYGLKFDFVYSAGVKNINKKNLKVTTQATTYQNFHT